MSNNSTVAFHATYSTCHDVSEQCPVSATLYGSYFSRGAGIFFAAAYILLLLQLFYMVKSRAWSYATWLGVGTIFELAGYVCRVMMSNNPWPFGPFVLQLLALMLAPTFITAAMSVTCKHLVMHYGTQWSAIRARWYPWLFVGGDVVSIIIQAAGCAAAAKATSGSGSNSSSTSTLSEALLITGVSFQLINMTICGVLMIIYYRRRAGDLQHGHRGGLPSQDSSTDGVMTADAYARGSGADVQAPPRDKIQIFVWAVTIGFTAVIIRCIYRIPEMATGWGSSLMQNETAFLILDGAMILLCVGLLTIVHPARYFPQLNGKGLPPDTKSFRLVERNGQA